MPSAEQWASFDKIINGLQHRIMLWEGTPTDDIRSELSKRNVQIVVFEPCGNKPPTGEFLTVMNGNLLNLKSVEL
jgi:zinc transport system substrate-binding protein